MITTIVMPVSRDTFLQKVFTSLEMLDCNPETTNLLVYVDGDANLYEKARNYTVKSRFNQKLCVYRKKGPANVSSIRARRQRIADIHNELKQYIKACDYVFLIEDDAVIPSNALTKLMRLYAEFPYAGFVTGVQIGRWGYTVPGIWSCDDVYETNMIKSKVPLPGVEQCDASGLYCMLTKRNHYVGVELEPFDEILGPDVYFGIDLRKSGYNNYVDWSLQIGHMTPKETITFKNTNLQQIIFQRQNGQWTQQVIDL